MMQTATYNPLEATDVYKLLHAEQYRPGVSGVYSYLTARSAKTFTDLPFFGLQYYLRRYLTAPLASWMADDLIEARAAITGTNPPEAARRIKALAALGYFPVEIKSIGEGMVVAPRTALFTIRSTHKDFYWVPGYVESLLLKVWYASTVAACCFKYRVLVEKMFAQTCCAAESSWWPDFAVHDFGYRSDCTEEGAAISGAAHALCFTGSDTVPARRFLKLWYGADAHDEPIIASVPASEHSVMCSFGRANELDAFRHMLRIYPAGLVSIVSDTFDLWNVLTNFARTLKDEILARDGKVVFRPDSGDPELIINGDPSAPADSPAAKGALRLLEEVFGSETNAKGFRVLNPKVGLIYGDGMYFDRYERTLRGMAKNGFAASNLVVGVGGILRSHTRDTLGFALKATHVESDVGPMDVEKDPITDPGKKSLCGLLAVRYDHEGKLATLDRRTPDEEALSILRPTFRNGEVLAETHFGAMRAMVRAEARAVAARTGGV